MKIYWSGIYEKNKIKKKKNIIKFIININIIIYLVYIYFLFLLNYNNIKIKWNINNSKI